MRPPRTLRNVIFISNRFNVKPHASHWIYRACTLPAEVSPDSSAIASLYSDPQLMSKSGSVVIAAEAALEYGFKDFNGKQPLSLREQKGSPRPFFTKS
jgi:hypothetical protein